MTRCLVIAEAGVNHGGDPAVAAELVDVAAEAGADAVKFQTFRAESVATASAPKAGYQAAQDGSHVEMLRRLELDEEAHRMLAARAAARGIAFMSTPFDLASLAFLTGDIGMRVVKVPSGEITNGPLLLAAARAADRLIVSTGMSTLDDIGAALAVVAFGLEHPDGDPGDAHLAPVEPGTRSEAALVERVTLLHCTSAYPTPAEDANLRAMATLRDAFGLPVGYSDHTIGIAVPVAAVALGATVLEKHFTLDRGLDGPDHAASSTPEELARLVEAVRDVETALGSGAKGVAPSEAANVDVARRSLVATRPIAAGEPFAPGNVTAKRPGGGVTPMRYWSILGAPAPRDFDKDEAIEL